MKNSKSKNTKSKPSYGASQDRNGGKGKFKSCNDIKWYSQNPNLLRDAGQITYGQIQGLPVSLGVTSASNIHKDFDVTIPGIMGINYIPGIGVSTDLNSNINVAARLVYTYIRHANSGNRNYEAPDYMTYLLAVGNAQLFYAWMVRTYGLINHASIQNRYVAKALVAACSCDYDDLVANMASFRYYINYYANKLNSLAVPKDQYIFDRMTFLPLHVFTDGEDPKSQMYIFKPTGIYLWNGTKYDTGSALVYEQFKYESNFERIKSFGDSILSALLENEDVGIMSGDTLKAYGAAGIRQVVPIDETYSTPILKDDGILAQIHNSLSLPEMQFDTNTFDITQSNGSLNYQIKGIGSSDFVTNAFLDCWFDTPDATFNMEATRLVTFVEAEPIPETNNFKFKVTTSGTEVIDSYDLYFFSGSSLTTNKVKSSGSVFTNSGRNFIPVEYVDLMTKFDWHPIIYRANVDNSAAKQTMFTVGDLQNYTVIDPSTVDKLHNCAIQSLFNVYGLYLKV